MLECKKTFFWAAAGPHIYINLHDTAHHISIEGFGWHIGMYGHAHVAHDNQDDILLVLHTYIKRQL